MSARVKQVGPAIKTREEMEEIVGQICGLTIERDLLTAQMDGYIVEVRDRYDTRIGGCGKRLDELMALAKDWAEANPSQFGTAKSIDMTHGTVGFRTGMPTVKTLAGWTWAKVLQAVKDMNLSYRRVKEEVDKDAILANREAIEPDIFRLIGVRVVQDESFFVEPKREPQEEARQVKGAA